ncbi:hypothetical protein ASE36_11050 [Rhizobium sp. Root274]|uniref:hypothetical protein n=1 Tax=unclassified Rhizobium TaxID=2613769 RepID=UPI00071576B3|nr:MULTISPECIES: hypothetical protein [unclassified Rhizobium]KQW29007.1 hypothetical protein ASC71_11070 [Rhizobium sp. Root1240]KRD29203.1 hypothetical protein ASE36_11050 [Rhizobium sp. Root274]
MLRDLRTGEHLELRGANSMNPSDLPLKKGLDLTKPIAARALSGRQMLTRQEINRITGPKLLGMQRAVSS